MAGGVIGGCGGCCGGIGGYIIQGIITNGATAPAPCAFERLSAILSLPVQSLW